MIDACQYMYLPQIQGDFSWRRVNCPTPAILAAIAAALSLLKCFESSGKAIRSSRLERMHRSHRVQARQLDRLCVSLGHGTYPHDHLVTSNLLVSFPSTPNTEGTTFTQKQELHNMAMYILSTFLPGYELKTAHEPHGKLQVSGCPRWVLSTIKDEFSPGELKVLGKNVETCYNLISS